MRLNFHVANEQTLLYHQWWSCLAIKRPYEESSTLYPLTIHQSTCYVAPTQANRGNVTEHEGLMQQMVVLNMRILVVKIGEVSGVPACEPPRDRQGSLEVQP